MSYTASVACVYTRASPKKLSPQTQRSAFGVVIDTGHSHIAGDLPGTAQRYGRRLKSLHIHDNDASSDQHRRIGHGTIDWRRFAGDLGASGYEGPLLLEITDLEPGEGLSDLLRESREALGVIASAMGTAGQGMGEPRSNCMTPRPTMR